MGARSASHGGMAIRVTASAAECIRAANVGVCTSGLIASRWCLSDGAQPRPSAPPVLQAHRAQKAHNLSENQARWIVLGDRASLKSEEATIVEHLWLASIVPEYHRGIVRGQGVRLGLSAEKEKCVYSSGFDSVILALNQVMLKVLLREGLLKRGPACS